MNLITQKFSLFIAIISIFVGCAGPQPRDAPISETNAKIQIENQSSQQSKTSSAYIYPYKTDVVVKTTPIVISVKSINKPKAVTIATVNNSVAKPQNKDSSTEISKMPSKFGATRKSNVVPKPSSKTQPVNNKPPVKLAVVTKSQAVTKPVTPIDVLLRQAETQRTTGDLVKAAATLERGVRIEPRNPLLWNKLARIRLEQGLFTQAHSMATKSNTMAGNSTQLLQENQRIISEATKRIKK